mgnify:FL=1
MLNKSFVAFSAFAALAACGGGGGGASDSAAGITPTDVTALWESPRNTGAGLVRAVSAEQNGVALVTDVNDENLGYRSAEIIEEISLQENADGSVSGEVVIEYADGEKRNVIGTFYDEARMYANVAEDGATVFAGGSLPQNLPVGTYSYAGAAESIYAYNGVIFDEVGQFNLDVQFGSKTAQLNAATPESQYVNNGLTVNDEGEINGDNGTFIVYGTDGSTVLDTRQIDFDGTVHGSGATHVSGIAVGGSTTADDFSAMAIVGKR